jgi:hypothetical protein
MAVRKTTRERLEDTIENMRAERNGFEQDWQEIGRLCLPNKVDVVGGGAGGFNSSNRSRRRANTKSHDTAPRIACRRLVNGMATGLTSSARPWFKLRTRDPDLREFQPVKLWLSVTEELIYDFFAKTNYYDATKMQYADLGAMGVGATIALEHSRYLGVYHHAPVGSFWLSVDDGLRTNRLVRRTLPTVEQVMAQAGGDKTKVSQHAQKAYDDGNYATIVPCMHVIERNEDARGNGLSPGIRKPWRSIKWEVGQNDRNILLSEKGFDSQPFTAPRWETVGQQAYCDTSPGFDALPDMRELQLTARSKMRAKDNLVKPAVTAPAGLARTGVELDPGSINYIDQFGGGEVVRPILQTDPRTLEFIRQDQEFLTRRVNEIFYADLFMAITDMEGVQPRNEQELFFRNEEKLTQLGPVVDRVNIEKLEVDIDRAFTILKNLALIPPPPPELEGVGLEVEFVSILAQAQKAALNSAIERAARFVGFLAGIFPEAALKFDAEQAVDEFAATSGTSPRIIRSDEMVAEIRKQMEAQQRQAQMAAAAAPMRDTAQAAKLLSETQVDPETSALQRLMGQ